MLTYEEARLFLEQASNRGSVLGLDNMRALMHALNNPQNEIRTVHIAGTNGKGSVGAFLASIFKEAGLKIGRYCSPAVFEPLECWQYDGRNITKEEYAACLSQVKEACDMLSLRQGIYPTVFEMETAMAFVYFKQMQVDVLLLETGLGGAEDATNVVEHPFACVFTTISRDHMQFLGESLTEIASVKAGIIKKGACVFSACQEPEVRAVLDTGMHQFYGKDALDSPQITYVDAEQLQFISMEPGRLQFQYKGNRYETSLSGSYQMRNAALAIEIAQKIFLALTELSKSQKGYVSVMLETDKQVEIIKAGVANTKWPGRFEIIGKEPFFLIDGAHNEDAVKQLALTLENSFTNQPIDFIIGILADKEHEKMLEYMMPFANRVFTVTPPNTRGLHAKILAEEVRKLHKDVLSCETIAEAIEKAIAHAKNAECPILAFGSLSYLGQLKENYKMICESRTRDV